MVGSVTDKYWVLHFMGTDRSPDRQWDVSCPHSIHSSYLSSLLFSLGAGRPLPRPRRLYLGRQAYLLVSSLFRATSPHASAEALHVAFASNVIVPSMPTSRPRDLATEIGCPRIEQLLATTTLFSGKLATEAEIAYSQTGATWMTPLMLGNARTDASARMFRIGLTGSEGSLRYGFTFRHAGQGFLLIPDSASREVWGEWKTGWVTFRKAVGQTWNNVEGEWTRSRLEQTYGRVGLLLNMPSWPELSLTYARSSLNSMLAPIGVAPQRSSNHTIEGAVFIHRPNWDLRLAASYILASDLLHSDADSNVRAQTLSAVLRPINTLVITPAFTYRQEFRSWSGGRIENPVASLAV